MPVKGTRSEADPAPVLSVILLTYNHERYIAHALHGILAQETDFGIEIIVTEDCSTDRTLAVIAEVQAETNAAFTLLTSPTNQCSNRVWRRALDVARGEFIATLDGDDYWTDAHKLARQVAFLRAHPDASMCFHDVVKVDDDTGDVIETTALGHLELSRCDLVLGNHVPGCSPVIRRSAIERLPPSFDDAEFGDWPLYLEAAAHGRVVGIGAVMGVYRLHRGGIWSGTSIESRERQRLRFLDSLAPEVRRTCRESWRTGRGYAMREVAASLIDQGRLGEARRLALRSLGAPGLPNHGRLRSLGLVARTMPPSWQRAAFAIHRFALDRSGTHP